MKEYFKNIPTINTERLTLRRIAIPDTDDMYEYSSDKSVTEYLLWRPHTDRDYTKRYIKALGKYYAHGEFFDWGIVWRDEDKMIGTCGFASIDEANNSAELGYVIAHPYWGRGIAEEAARAVIDIGFHELGLNRIEARYMIGNEASERVMQKLGMTKEGVCRSEIFVKGAYRDIGHYAILKSDWVK